MKKYLVLFFLFASLTSFGQFSNYTNINGRYKWIAGKFDSTFTLPSGTTPSLRVGGGTGPGALFYSTTDSTVYQYTGTRWTRLRGTDTAHVVSAYVRNTTASTMTAGQVVYINGSTGTTPTIALAVNTADSTSAMTFGFVRGTIAPNAFGWITSFGPLEGVNTNAYTEGEVIYLDSIPGQFTHDKPQAPYHMVTLGYIVKKSGGNGTIFAKIQNGYELDELHNVRITAPVLNKSVIIYDSVRRLWVDTTVSAAGLGLGGSGTTNYLSKWTSSSALGNSLVFDNGTNVGIGTTSPAYKLDVSGTTRLLSGTTSFIVDNAQTFNVELNGNFRWRNGGSFIMNIGGTGAVNIWPGVVGGQYTLINNGITSTFGDLTFSTVGPVERMRLFSATGNFSIGTAVDAGYRLDVSGTFRSTGDANINGLTVGRGGGTRNAIISNAASITTATDNVLVGNDAGLSLTTGGENTFIGPYAGRSTTTSGQSVYVGAGAGQNSNSSWNVHLGYAAGQNARSGFNLFIGPNAGQGDNVTTTATQNVAIGRDAMRNYTTGTFNTVLGYYAGRDLTTGSNNIFIGGVSTGNGITTGSHNTIIGANVTGLSSSLSNTIILADGQGNQRLYINNSGLVSVGGNTIFEGGFNITRNSSISLGNTAGIVINATNSVGNTELLLGASESSSASYIQSASQNSSWTNRPLLLQPNGGNVGIGTTSPAHRVDVNMGSVFMNTNIGLNVSGDAGGNIGYTGYRFALTTSSGNVTSILQNARTSGTAFLGTQFSSESRDGIAFLTATSSPAERMRLTAAGRLLLGTSVESTYLLDVNGTARVQSDAVINTLTIGLGGGSVASNTAIGYQSINATATGVGNTGLGYQAIRALTSGPGNVGIGYQSLLLNTTGSYNVAIGYIAGYKLTTGSENTLVGYLAGGSLTTQGGNVHIGHGAGGNSTVAGNTYIGYRTMVSNTTGTANTTLGYQAGLNSTTQSSLTLIGYAAGQSASIGSNNVLIGDYAGQGLTTSENTAVGSQSLISVTSGAKNTALGYYAGRYVTAGTGNQTSSNSLYLGHDTRASVDGNTNEIVIGYQARGNGSNTVTLGNTSIVTTVLQGSVGIGTTSPNASALLDVSSTTKGFLPPRMTGANAEAIGTPEAGLLVYINNGNGTTITSTGWWGYDGTTWVKLN